MKLRRCQQINILWLTQSFLRGTLHCSRFGKCRVIMPVPSARDNNCLGTLAGCMIGLYQVWSSILVLASSWFDVSLSTMAADSWVNRYHTIPWVTRNLLADKFWWFPYLPKKLTQTCLVLYVGEKSAPLMDCLTTCIILHPQTHLFSVCQEFWLSNIYRCQTLCQIDWIITTASCN